jgi:VanZ family protein
VRRLHRILYYWAPAALWAAVVLSASSEPFAAAHTGEWIQEIVTRLAGSPLAPEAFETVHFTIRKLGHLTEYAIFGALAWRAYRGDRSGWAPGWAIAAILMASVLAGIDEWHQTFVQGRMGAVGDVIIDICGATLSQLMMRRL